MQELTRTVYEQKGLYNVFVWEEEKIKERQRETGTSHQGSLFQFLQVV